MSRSAASGVFFCAMRNTAFLRSTSAHFSRLAITFFSSGIARSASICSSALSAITRTSSSSRSHSPDARPGRAARTSRPTSRMSRDMSRSASLAARTPSAATLAGGGGRLVQRALHLRVAHRARRRDGRRAHRVLRHRRRGPHDVADRRRDVRVARALLDRGRALRVAAPRQLAADARVERLRVAPERVAPRLAQRAQRRARRAQLARAAGAVERVRAPVERVVRLLRLRPPLLDAAEQLGGALVVAARHRVAPRAVEDVGRVLRGDECGRGGGPVRHRPRGGGAPRAGQRQRAGRDHVSQKHHGSGPRVRCVGEANHQVVPTGTIVRRRGRS